MHSSSPSSINQSSTSTLLLYHLNQYLKSTSHKIESKAKMQFLTAATLFAAALAAPAPQTSDCPNPAHCGGSAPDPSTFDNVDVTDFFLRKNPGILNAGFKLSGKNGTVQCEIGAVESLPSEVEVCGDSKYRFGLIEATGAGSEVGLRLYRETGLASGLTGSGDVPTYCHAGGDGPDDFVCQQTNALTIVIS